MTDDLIKTGRIVTVFGGSGFIGRHVVRALAKDGWRIRVATRRPDLAFHLQPLGRVGQIHAVQANVRFPNSVAAALRETDAVVNLVGVLQDKGRQSFEATHVFGARAIGRAAKDAGIANVVHMSALGADAGSDCAYARTKAAGEAAMLEQVPTAIALRPSIVFGPEDQFFNRFAAMARYFPVLPLFGGGETRMQPVFAGDVAQCVARALAGSVKTASVYEIGGPRALTMREIMQFVCNATGRKRLLVPVPAPLDRWAAFGAEIADMLSLGLFPKMLVMTRDQLKMLHLDNVVSETANQQGRTIAAFGVTPETIEAIVPDYLVRFRKTGQFETPRLA